MALKLLEVLKEGLANFTETIKTRKKELGAKLARAETISSSDEHWLDGEANTEPTQPLTLSSKSRLHSMIWLLQGRSRQRIEWMSNLFSTQLANLKS